MRKQGPKEKFQDYYLDMVRIFRNMSVQWDSDRKFKLLFRNTREDCKTAMLAAKIKTIPAMREFGKQFDSINWQIYNNNTKENNYLPRRNTKIEEIGQQQSYQRGGNGGNRFQENRFQENQGGQKTGYQGKNFNPNYKPPIKQSFPTQQGGKPPPSGGKPQFQPKPSAKQESGSGPERKPEESRPGPSGTDPLQRILKAYIPIKKGVCFNCHDEGHRFQDCDETRKTFCENCGFPGFPTKDCPFCESKNVRRTAQ